MSTKLLNIIYRVGIIAMVLGVLDPLEGSVIIAAGSILLAYATHKRNDRHRRIFLASAIMIITGVFFLFYVSSLGGFDPRTEWWWFIPLAPYPVGWILTIIMLIKSAWGKSPNPTGQPVQ